MSYYLQELDKERLKDRQVAELETMHARAKKITGEDLGRWHIAYDDESRPGRGHSITAWAADGENLATAYLDPYGHGPLVICSVELIHNDSDEEHFDEDGRCEHEQD